MTEANNICKTAGAAVLLGIALLFPVACRKGHGNTQPVKDEAAQQFSEVRETLSPPPPLEEIGCAAFTAKDSLILLTLGQSNAANFGATRFDPASPNIAAYSGGHCFRGRDPLPGGEGMGGSPWTRLAAKILGAGKARNVLLANVSEGGRTAAEFVDGPLHERLLETVRGLLAAGLAPGFVLYHQGETDARFHTPPEVYRSEVLALVKALRDAGVHAPFYVARATHCYGWMDEGIYAAQQSLAGAAPEVLAGPDTNSLGDEYRYDTCHFNAEGLDRHAGLWFRTLFPSR